MFTDIEGSTRLLAALGEGYEPLHAAHAEILRRTIAASGGIEVSTEGDAFFAAFQSAIGAVRAATQSQQELASTAWPDDARVRVRMGLHTGEGRLGGDDYIGLDVHRAARIAAAGHGGQVLLSDACRVLVAADLPDGVRLRDLAEHRLKDLPAPERIWQLEIDGLQSDFPAIRSLDARPNNLPQATTSLIGREGELAEVAELLGPHRLVTLAGPGGTGKTRLGLAAARQLLPRFEDGVFFVRLEDARDRQAVVSAIAAAVGVRETVQRDLEAGVKAFTASRTLLLVLDNFEQVIAAAPLVSELLASGPALRVLVTSRSPLHLSGEREYAVPPLRLPDLANLPPLTVLSQYESVALFIDRATAVRSDFAVDNANAPAVAEICSRLDGLPLAIELAAARVKVFSPQTILERLARSLPVLGGGPQDLPARQRTLNSAMSWSFELLEAAERRLFERLAVFAGGWSLEMSEVVCNPGGELGADTLDLLTSLVDKSLVRPEPDDEARFSLLQVVREFAADRLEARAEADDVRRRHALEMLVLAERAEPELLLTDLRSWQRRVRRDADNVRAAVRWAIDAGEAQIALRITSALWRYYQYWAELREARRWLEAALALPDASQPGAARANGLRALGAVRYWLGDAERASAAYQEALDYHRQVGDDRQLADALFDAAWAAVARGDIPGATSMATDARSRYLAAADRTDAARVAAFAAGGAFLMGGGGSKEPALESAREALRLCRQDGRLLDEADQLGSIAFINFRAGDDADALVAFREAVEAWRRMENVGMLGFLKLGAAAELNLGRTERAARLAGVAARAVEDMGGELPAAMIGGIDPLDRARERLPPDVYEAAVAEGRAMSFEEATAYALEL